MKRANRIAVAAAAALVFVAAAKGPANAAAAVGSIEGSVRLSGKSPGNVVIRMGMDPACASLNRGTRVLQEAVVTSADGGLANVFVRVEGAFPRTPAPRTPVTIDQHRCVYGPRVVGVQTGQMLQVKNGDDLLHNVHAISRRSNGFNVSEPKAGMVQQFRMKDEEVMLRLKCDVHRWMTAYIGVVSHPYFAVSGPSGAFTIRNVPSGTYTLRTWHERYGELTQSVRVRPGATTQVIFAYTGTEKAPAAGLRNLAVPAAVLTAR